MTWAGLTPIHRPAQDVGRLLNAFCTLPDDLVAGDESARGRTVCPSFFCAIKNAPRDRGPKLKEHLAQTYPEGVYQVYHNKGRPERRPC